LIYLESLSIRLRDKLRSARGQEGGLAPALGF
jgi:hypothetical protein